MSGLPPMPWYPAWFAQSTFGWPRIAIAVYRELLDKQWLSGGLAEDPNEISKMINAAATEWAYWSSHIHTKFPVQADACDVPNPLIVAAGAQGSDVRMDGPILGKELSPTNSDSCVRFIDFLNQPLIHARLPTAYPAGQC
jgi:hypothetical protein